MSKPIYKIYNRGYLYILVCVYVCNSLKYIILIKQIYNIIPNNIAHITVTYKLNFSTQKKKI